MISGTKTVIVHDYFDFLTSQPDTLWCPVVCVCALSVLRPGFWPVCNRRRVRSSGSLKKPKTSARVDVPIALLPYKK